MKKIFHEIHWFEFSHLQKIIIFMALLFHISLLFSVSNRGDYGNNFFGAWRPFAYDTSGWIGRGGDFFAVYEAGHQALLGRPVFNVQPELNALPKTESMLRAPYVATFRYPPLFAYTISVLLNIFPPVLSYKLWILFNEFLIFIGIYLTAKRPKNAKTAFAVILVWLAFYPLHIEYYMGQFSLFMGFLLFFCALNLLENKNEKAVSWWGISLFVKTYSLPFFLYWFFRKKIKRPLIWIVAFFLTSGIYFLLFPSDFKMFYERGIAGRMFSKGEEKVIEPQKKNDGGAIADISQKVEKTAPKLYWGSMGVQRGVLALTRIFYLQQDEKGNFLTPYWAHYFLYLTILFPIPFLVIAARRPQKNPLATLTLFALGWFFWYFDTWEHHYTLILPLFALLISEEIVKGWRAAVIYILLASPSLWLFFGSPETNPLTPHNQYFYFALENFYYLIKPIGIVFLFIFLYRCKKL